MRSSHEIVHYGINLRLEFESPITVELGKYCNRIAEVPKVEMVIIIYTQAKICSRILSTISADQSTHLLS